MKRFFVVIFIIALVVSFAGSAIAAGRIAAFKKLYFGDSFHKSPAGIQLCEMSISWDEAGVTKLKYILSAFKGKTTFVDLYFISTYKDKTGIVYKMSDHRKMGQTFCNLECVDKRENNTLLLTPSAGPFDLDSGQVWFEFKFDDQTVYVIWEMKTNKLDWYKAGDKQVPPMM